MENLYRFSQTVELRAYLFNFGIKFITIICESTCTTRWQFQGRRFMFKEDITDGSTKFSADDIHPYNAFMITLKY